MSTPTDRQPLPKASLRSLAVSAIHDGYQAELQVHQFLVGLRSAMAHEPAIVFHSWGVVKLEAAPDIRADSIRRGADAHLIIVSTSHQTELPDHVRRWLDAVLQDQPAPRALLVAISGGPQASSRRLFTEMIEKTARRWQTDSVCFETCRDTAGPTALASAVAQRLLVRREAHLMRDDAMADETVSPPIPEPHIMNRVDSSLTPQEVEAVRESAYHLWLDAGCPAGREVDFWLQAECQFLRQAARKRTRRHLSAPRLDFKIQPPSKKHKHHENPAPTHRDRYRNHPHQLLQPVSAHIRPGRRARSLPQLVRSAPQQPQHTTC